jgi:hypothetical protein
VGCGAHVRRKFFEAQSSDKARAGYVLGLIQNLYAVEAQAREEKLSPENRKQLRLEKARPVLNELGAWTRQEGPKVLPRSALGMAIQYTAQRRSILMNYLQDGCLEIDNNWIENKIRAVALGRKNYLFAGNDKTAQHAAMMYSFFATCKSHGVNEYEWLKFVLDNIVTIKTEELDKLLPQNFKRISQRV